MAYNNKINNKSKELLTGLSSLKDNYKSFNNPNNVTENCENFKNFLNKMNNIKENYQEIINKIELSYNKDIKANQKEKENEIKKIEQMNVDKKNEIKREEYLKIEKLEKQCNDKISNLENIKNDLLINKYKAHIKLGEIIYNNYKNNNGNILKVKNMHNLLYIYYNDNDIYNNIVLKIIDNWDIGDKDSFMRKKNYKLKNFVEEKGIKGMFNNFLGFFTNS